MIDLMTRGMRWLSRMQRRNLSVRIVYERPASSDTPYAKTIRLGVPATLGGAGATSDQSVDPMRLDVDDVDFLITAADLRVDGNILEPRADDRIYHSKDGTTQVYEVLPRGGEKPWRWCDSQRTIRRIHARHVDSYPTPGGA